MSTRLFAAGIAAATLGVLITAAWLSPASEGHGTHLQLGMDACQWAVRFGRPCPTCGMTTAFAYAANLQPLEAFKAQPMGAIGAIAFSVVFWISMHVAVFGSQIGRVVLSLIRPRVVWTTFALLVAAWGYKIAIWKSGG